MMRTGRGIAEDNLTRWRRHDVRGTWMCNPASCGCPPPTYYVV